MDIQDKIRQRRHHLEEARMIQNELENMLYDFKGTVEEAIGIGLVKPNFPTSSAFRHSLRKDKFKKAI